MKTLVVILILASATLTACSRSDGHNSSSSSVSKDALSISQPAAFPGTAGGPSNSCKTQFTTWATRKGGRELKALGSALTKFSLDQGRWAGDLATGSRPAADENAIVIDIGKMEGAALALKRNMPPSCVPNVDRDFGNMVTSIQEVGAYQALEIRATNQNNSINATAYGKLVTASLMETLSDLQSAANDISSFTENGS